MKVFVSSRHGRLSRVLCALLALVVLVGVLPVGTASAYADNEIDPAAAPAYVDGAFDPADGAQTPAPAAPAPAEKLQRKVEATDTTNGVCVGVEGVMPADAQLVLKTLSDEALSWLRAGRTLAEDEFFLVYSLCLVTPDGAELEVVPGESEYRITVYFTAKDKCFAPDLAVAALGGTLGALETDAANAAAQAAALEPTPEPTAAPEADPTETEPTETDPTEADPAPSAPKAEPTPEPTEPTPAPAAEPTAAPESTPAPADNTPADPEPTEPTEPTETADPADADPAESDPAPAEQTETTDPAPVEPEKPADIAVGPVFNGASYAVFTANSLGIFKFAGTSYFASDPAEPTAAPEVLAASAGDFAFAAQGALPADAAALSVTPIEAEQDELAEALCDFGVQLDGEGTIFAFDIKLLDALGAELQPVDGAVEISISGLPTDAPLRVIHRHHDVPALMSADAPAARAVPAAPVEELPCALTGDTLTFSTTGFSEYYIVSGHAQYDERVDGKSTIFDADGQVIEMKELDNDTIFVAPGTTLRFASRFWNGGIIIVNPDANNIALSWWKYDDYSNGRITAARPKWDAQGGGSDSDIHYYTSSWSGATINNMADNVADVNVSRDAQPDDYIKLYNSWDTKGSNQTSVTIIVKDEMEVVEKTFDNDTYPVFLTVLADASGGTPSEPSTTTKSYYYADSKYTVATNSYPKFAANSTGIIDKDKILYNPNFVNSADGTTTMGIVRKNGVEPRDYVSGVDWELFLKNIASKNSVKATDGKIVNSSNVENYDIIPYVVKLHTANSLGWHIDCYIVPKGTISLHYDANLAPGYSVDNLSLPDTVNGTKEISSTVGYAKKNSNNIGLNQRVKCKDDGDAVVQDDKYVTFTGWNTAPDGTGTSYKPNEAITIDKDTTLYAQWEYTPDLTTGTLKVQKIVVDQEKKLTNEEFTMKLDVTGLTGKLYDSNGKFLDDKISSESFTLKHGEYALFTLPVNSKVTVTETSTGDYTPSYDKQSVTIKQGATSIITVTNTYKAPTPVEQDNITVNVKKTVSGTYGDVKKSFTLKVGYRTEENGDITWFDSKSFTNNHTETYDTVPSGAYLVIEETDATGYTMTAKFGENAAATQANYYVVTSPSALTANTDVTVNNKRDAIPDTGVALDALPYALALAVAVVGAAMLLARPRRRRE